MSQWKQDIFEELISDTQFASWARGEDLTNEEYWNSWETNHPLNIVEFQEAIRIVNSLRFNRLDINPNAIRYLWSKTSDKIHQEKQFGRFHQFLLFATRVAAVLLIPLMMVSAWLYYNQYNLTQKYSNLLQDKQDQKVTVVAPIGARILVDLPDGSKAWLNSGSEISYPIIFNTSERRVNLVGEAYFKVQKSETPFYVSSLGPEIKVYGTEFNVNSYYDEEMVTIALADGKISLDMNGKEEFLLPGQVAFFDKKSNSASTENSEVNVYSGWREGKYVFMDTSLSSILRILQRQHNVKIQLLNPELGNYRYKVSINNESLEQILNLLSISAPIKYNYKHKALKPDGTYETDNIEISADKTRIIKTK
jgi:ferric-dicitrate binding protein FerR (iron transport regulator)